MWQLLIRKLGLRWFEWVFILSLVLLSIVVYVQHQLYKDTQRQLEISILELSEIMFERDRLIQLRQLDSITIADLLKQQDILENTHRQADEEFHREYKELVEGSKSEDTSGDVVSDGESEPRSTSTDSGSHDVARIALIAERLQFAYDCSRSPYADCASSYSSEGL